MTLPLNTMEKAVKTAPEIKKSEAEKQESYFQECVNDAIKKINTTIATSTIESLKKGTCFYGSINNANDYKRFEKVIQEKYLPDFHVKIGRDWGRDFVRVTYLNGKSIDEYEKEEKERLEWEEKMRKEWQNLFSKFEKAYIKEKKRRHPFLTFFGVNRIHVAETIQAFVKYQKKQNPNIRFGKDDNILALPPWTRMQTLSHFNAMSSDFELKGFL